MGLLEESAEQIRRVATGDNKFTDQKPFILELRAPPAAFSITTLPLTYCVLPLGLQGYSVVRRFRQSITPTIGGLVVEEQGELWREISVDWDPGMKPKYSLDTSQLPVRNSVGLALSGMAWTQRILQNYFDNYAKLKAHPLLGKDTYLLWHDLKLDEHYVVVPTGVTMSRVSGKKHRFPLKLEFVAVAPADAIAPFASIASLLGSHGAGGVIGKIGNTIVDVTSRMKQGVAVASAAVAEGNVAVSEVRYFADQVDEVLTDVKITINAARAFLTGRVQVMPIGRDFVNQTAENLENLLFDWELTPEIPDSMRQNYMSALDGLHSISAARGNFGDTYETSAARQKIADLGPVGRASNAALLEASTKNPASTLLELGKASIPVTAKGLVEAGAGPKARTYRQYDSFTVYTVKATDTIQSIAASQMKDGALWYDIAIFNGLKAPYISETAITETVSPGDKIKIPTIGFQSKPQKIDNADSVYLTDWKLIETADSRPGVPTVTTAIDRRTYQDFALVTGIPNLAQALQIRHWTERGALPLVPAYGLRRILGLGSTAEGADIVKLNFRENMLQDPRVQTVSGIKIEVTGDRVDIEADILPVNETDTIPIRSVVV